MSTMPKRTKLIYKYAEEQETKHEEQTEEEKKTEVLGEDYEAYPPYNFSWFIENKVVAMGWPQTVANLNYLVDVGVDHLITLSPEMTPPILECKKKLKWTELHIEDFDAPTVKQILKFIEICERAEIRGEVIGVHCRQGRGRTGTMLACYLVHFKHMTAERALHTVREQRPGSCETDKQEEIVCHYHDYKRGTVENPDYRIVDNKPYFDFGLKYLFDGDETERRDPEQVEESEGEKFKLKSSCRKTKRMLMNNDNE